MVFRTSEAPNGTVVVHASGRIEAGDAAELRARLAEAGGRPVALVISSGGGEVAEAFRIVRMVSDLRMPVLVPQSSRCASACFFILAASPRRMADRTARIGVHSMSLEGAEGLGTLGITALAGRVASDMGVPPSVVGKMVATPPDSMAWLSDDEIQAMRIEVVDLRSVGLLPLLSARTAAAARPAAPSAALPPDPVALPSVSEQEGEIPRIQVEGRAPAFAEGLSARTDWERWLSSLSDERRRGALIQRPEDVYQPVGSCRSASPAQRPGCEAAAERLAPVRARISSDDSYAEGWRAFLLPAYRDSVLLVMRACRRQGGILSLGPAFEARQDLNGDGREDIVIDYEAATCSAGSLSVCDGGACRLEVYLSGAGPVARLAFSAYARSWQIRPGRPSIIEIEPRACAVRAGCKEIWRIEGDRTFPGAR